MSTISTHLYKSPVTFDRGAHTYHLDGVVLGGVTPIVKWMYPKTYDGIPADVLQRAADFGSLVHAKIELYDTLGITDGDTLVADYIALKNGWFLQTACNEYLVSDEEHIASSIDVVFDTIDTGNSYAIGDIKTTSKLHVENVTLQLSIYAYLFERQNAGKKVGQLLAIWLPKPKYGKAAIMPCKRIPGELCAEIINTYAAGGDPAPLRERINQTTKK